MPKDLDLDLDLSDLDIEITAEDLESPILRQTIRPDTAPTWHVQARVLVIERTICSSCGAVYEAPGAKGLLARFVNRRNLDTQEMGNHPAAMNPELPLATRTLVKSVGVCQRCVK